MQDTYQELLRLAEDAGLPLILIGGHAVNALGYERTTLDFDFLARGDDLAAWREILLQAGWSIAGETASFVHFAPPEPDGFRLDLMVVDAPTFAKIAAAGGVVRYGHRDVRVPSVLHLIALKLHALKNPGRAESGKDYGDILALIRRHQIDTFSGDFQAILDRYAAPAIRARIERDSR